MKKLAIVCALLVVSACSQAAVPTEPIARSTPEPANFFMSFVATHNNANDCWLVIRDKVYNVTPFILDQKHPGGAAILQGCGKDATSMFESRPDATSHSPMAREILDNYYIGELNK